VTTSTQTTLPVGRWRAADALQLVGGTPLVKLNRVVPEGAAEVWAKLESMNPAGSVKDRIAKAMIAAAR